MVILKAVNLLCALLVPLLAVAAAEEITLVTRLPISGSNSICVSARPPLRAMPLIELPVGAVRARGWLELQLRLMSEGQAGRLPRRAAGGTAAANRSTAAQTAQRLVNLANLIIPKRLRRMPPALATEPASGLLRCELLRVKFQGN